MSEREGLSAVERYRLAKEARRRGPPLTIEPAPELGADTLWRGLVRDGSMRLLVARCTETVRENASRLSCGEAGTRMVGEALLSALLLRSTLSPGEQLQLVVRQRGGAGRIIADVRADGRMRATMEHPGAADADRPGAGILEVARTRGGSTVYRSSVTMRGALGDTAMHYLLSSEQIVSLLRLEVGVREGELAFAGGYLVQLMPEGRHGDLERLVANLDTLTPLAEGMVAGDPDGRGWAAELMRGFRWDQCARERVRFGCNCSQERVLAMLSTLPLPDLEDMARGSEALSTTCDYCATTYEVSTAQIRALLSNPS